MLRYAVLGPVEVHRGTERLSVRGRPLELLADLLVHANEAVSADQLIDDLWGPGRSDRSAKNLQMAVNRLRSTLGKGPDGASPVQSMPRGYRLAVAPGELDVDVLERHVRAAVDALRDERPGVARESALAGLDLWRGPALAEVAYEPWALELVRRLEERKLDALETLIEADLRLPDYADAIGRLRTLVEEHPLRERFTAQLMRALYQSGRQQEALDVYRKTRARLHELGLEPGSALVALQRQILTHDGALAGPASELPPVLRGLPSCIGRVQEKGLITAAVEAAVAGSRTVVCIGGEPGVGKTLLAAHAAIEAFEGGSAVGWGASMEGMRPPYGTWIAPLTQLAEQTRPDLSDVERGLLAPLIGPAEPALSRRPASDPEGERYRLFNAVVRLLRKASAVSPLVVVLDDLQWADTDSLMLLRFIANEPPGDLRASIVATFRHSELDAGHPLPNLLADLDRVPGVTRLLLAGLDAADVATFMATRSRRGPYRAGHHLIEEITAETGGNPFFVGEIVRHLDETGEDWDRRGSIATLGLPRKSSDLVRRRVRRVDRAEAVLGVAAVVGHEFDIELVECLVGGDPLDVLEAAERAALLRAHSPGRYSFTHAIVQHALYDGLSHTRRAQTHFRVAEALERDPGASPGVLAHHWARTEVPEHRRRATVYARRAGEQALQRLAPDEAKRWCTEAHELLPADGGDDVERCDVLIGLGEAKRRVGDATFRDDLLEASRIATREGDVRRLTRAVLANTLGPFGAAGAPDQERLDSLERAVDLVPKDSRQHPLMLAVLARELYYGGDPDCGDVARGSQLSLTAIERARELDEPLELARVMAIATAISPISSLDAHEQLVSELTELTDRIGDPELRFRAANATFIYGMHSGEPIALAAGLQVMRGLDDELHQPLLHWTRLWAESAYCTLAGDLAGGETLTTEAELEAIRHERPQAKLVTFGQLLSIRTEQAMLDTLRDRLDELTAANRHLPVLRLAGGFIDAETGRLPEAHELLMKEAGKEFNFPFDRTIAFSLARCADIALRVGARDVARELYRRLLSYEHQFATPAGLSSRGSIQLSLGRLATMLDELKTAEKHLELAERAHKRLRAPVLQARSALASAQLAMAGGERERAAELAERARRLAPMSAAVARDARALEGMHVRAAT